MNIGYACLCIGVPDTGMSTCNMKNADMGNLVKLISHNLDSLEKIIDYNILNNIKLFRISSDVIPFASSPVNTLNWWDIFEDKFKNIGQKIVKAGIRVSMHPGQYTVLNSIDELVVERAVQDLEYHTRFLDSLGVDSKNKIVLHIGGVYNDKESSIKRFIKNYNSLDEKIKARLVIENDDRSYNISQVLEISEKTKAPVVFDNLHNSSNPSGENKDDLYWINLCTKTWLDKDGPQKMHYSQQDNGKRRGAHSGSIRILEFLDYFKLIKEKNIDIMLEVKDKNLSAIKCINATTMEKKINLLENEWSRYKYTVLEKAPNIYLEIRKLLKNKDEYPALEFYGLLEQAMFAEAKVGDLINSAQHVWGYFSDKATKQEKEIFFKKIEEFENGKQPIKAVKNHLWKLTLKYQEEYLKNSYYFFIY